MTTQRLYYTDSYTTTFDAQCVERTNYEGSPAVVLDRSYFYPTSGGQPHDTGTLNGIPVIDVAVREDDAAVLHVLARPLDGDRVHGAIDWARRFDYMQHHTGQHILSQAFLRLAEAATVGFHMSEDSITIDLDTPEIAPDLLDRVETLANEVVFEDRPVRAWFPDDEERGQMALRKVPEVEGKFRVVAVEDFDLTACGGTHVARSGAVGAIKVLRTERRGDTTRVEFRCGERALRDYREKNALMNQLAAALTTGYWEVPAALERLREENKELRRELRAARSELLEHQARRLRQDAALRDGYALVIQVLEGDAAGDARELAQKLIAHPQTVALCGAASQKAQIVAARSDDLPFDMVPALKAGLAVLGVDRGGGRPSFAQGGGVAATADALAAALAEAAAQLQSQHS